MGDFHNIPRQTETNKTCRQSMSQPNACDAPCTERETDARRQISRTARTPRLPVLRARLARTGHWRLPPEVSKTTAHYHTQPCGERERERVHAHALVCTKRLALACFRMQTGLLGRATRHERPRVRIFGVSISDSSSAPPPLPFGSLPAAGPFVPGSPTKGPTCLDISERKRAGSSGS